MFSAISTILIHNPGDALRNEEILNRANCVLFLQNNIYDLVFAFLGYESKVIKYNFDYPSHFNVSICSLSVVEQEII